MKSEVTAIDSSSRWPLLLLVGSALHWLVLSSVLALAASIQLHHPSFLAECPVFTHGRLQSIAESAFTYGWLGNAGLAVSLWILARLGGEPLRAQSWVHFGAIFWNTGIALGLVAIAFGEGTSIPLLGMPRYVQPILLAAYSAIAVSGILSWTGRTRQISYAAQWYAAAPLFLFPWFFSLVQVMLFWHPARGVVQSVVSSWYAQAAWTLWIAPAALSGAYYILPKLTGKTVRAYEFAALGFWSLLFIGAWTGGRHLIGGPVPAWISALAVVTSALLLFHYLIVGINLRCAHGTGATAAKFIGIGILAYLAGGIADCVTSFHGVAAFTQFTYVEDAQHLMAFYGAASMILLGGLYFAIPRISGKAWASAFMIRAHWGLSVIGLILVVGGLAWAGLEQGHDLLVPGPAGVFPSFGTIAAHTHRGLLLSSMGWAALVLANLLILVNFLLTLCPCREDGEAKFQQPSIMEASAS